MKINNLFLFTIICTLCIQNIYPMSRYIPRLKGPASSSLANQPNENVKIITPETTVQPETIKAATAELSTEQAQTSKWHEYKLHPQHSRLKQQFKQSQQQSSEKAKQAQESAKPKAKSKFWDSSQNWSSAKKYAQAGLNVAGISGTAASGAYAYQQQDQASQEKMKLQQYSNKLTTDFTILEKIINTWNSNQKTWTKEQYNLLNQFLQLYNYVIETWTTEQLLAEYIKLQNEFIAIQDTDFNDNWNDRLFDISKGRGESDQSYKNRKAQKISDFQKGLHEHEIIKNTSIKQIHTAQQKSNAQLKSEIQELKKISLLNKEKIKDLPAYTPQTTFDTSRTFSFEMPQLPEMPNLSDKISDELYGVSL